MARYDDAEESRRLRTQLEALLVALFAYEPRDLRRLFRELDPSIAGEVTWDASARRVVESVCGHLTQLLGEWEMIVRVTSALLEAFPRNPDVQELHRLVCASAYSGSLPVSYTLRETAVHQFLDRHFGADEYAALRAFDERGSRDADAVVPYSDEELAGAARYFDALARGLQRASEVEMRTSRLDVISYLLEGAIGYRSCRGLFHQLRRALATAELPRKQDEQTVVDARPPAVEVVAAPQDLAGVLPAPEDVVDAGPSKQRVGAVARAVDACFRAVAAVQEALNAYLDAGLWPPVAHAVGHAFVTGLPDSSSLPISPEKRRTLDAFAANLRALLLLEGVGILERGLIARIDDELPQLSAHLSPRLRALLRYRRCLAHVYCGEWTALRAELEAPPPDWDDNWSGFLWYELGEFERSRASYQRAVDRGAKTSLSRAVGLRGLLALVPVTHPLFAGSTADDRVAALTNADRARKRGRAELEREIADARHHLPAAQSLFDRVTMLGLAAECAAATRRVHRAADLQESGRGLSFGGDRTGPLTRTYNAFWLVGVPALGLRDEVATELVHAALRIDPLPSVLEAAHLTCTIDEWNRDRLARAAERLAAQESMGAWHTLLLEQTALLRQHAEELARQRLFERSDRSLESLELHPVATRLTSLVNFFGCLMQRSPGVVLGEVAKICAGVLRRVEFGAYAFRNTISTGLGLVLGACRRLHRTPGDFDLEPRVLARILTSGGDLDWSSRHALRLLWPDMHEDARRGLVTSLCELLAAWPESDVHALLGAESDPLESRVERLFSGSDLAPLSSEALVHEVARHWSSWKERGYAEPPLLLAPPPAKPDVDAQWQLWRPAILQALADGALTRPPVLARPWLNRGIDALSALALQTDDVSLWLALFAQIRPWPLPHEDLGSDLSPLRRALERDAADDLRRRFHRRLLSADAGDEWLAVVQLFRLSFEAGQKILLEDVEALRSFWERTPIRDDDAAAQVYLVLDRLLERWRDGSPGEKAPLWPHLDPILTQTPKKVRRGGLLAHGLRDALGRVCQRIEDGAAGDVDRDAWRRLRTWLDEHEDTPRRA